jgi:hypothetical protein
MIADYYSVFAEYSSKILVLSLEHFCKNEYFAFMLVTYRNNVGLDIAFLAFFFVLKNYLKGGWVSTVRHVPRKA